jgi:hypothetical protein
MFWWFFWLFIQIINKPAREGSEAPKKMGRDPVWILNADPGCLSRIRNTAKKQDVTRLTSILLYMDPFSFDAFWHLAFGSMYNKILVKGPKPLKTGTALLSTN